MRLLHGLCTVIQQGSTGKAKGFSFDAKFRVRYHLSLSDWIFHCSRQFHVILLYNQLDHCMFMSQAETLSSQHNYLVHYICKQGCMIISSFYPISPSIFKIGEDTDRGMSTLIHGFVGPTLCTTARVHSYVLHYHPVLCIMVHKGNLFLLEVCCL